MVDHSICHDLEYLDLLEYVVEDGEKIEGRNGPTRQLLAGQMHFDLRLGFPLLVTKWVNWRAVVDEFQWMVCDGSTDVKWLNDRGHTFWDLWKGKDGSIGKGYGYQFRRANGIDQVQRLIDNLQKDPYSRRHIINLWNVEDLDEMTLVPCHMMTQWFVDTEGHLSCSLYQRSADMFLGVPWNIAFYGLFVHVLAQITGLKPGMLIWNGGSCHVYENHLEAVYTQLDQPICASPQVSINPRLESIDDFTPEDVKLIGYVPGPKIPAPISA